MKKIIQSLLKTKVAQLIIVELISTLFDELQNDKVFGNDERLLILVVKNYLIQRIKGDTE